MAQSQTRRLLSVGVLVIFMLLWLVHRTTYSSMTNRKVVGPPVVMVLATHSKLTPYLQKVIANREEYAAHHGYHFVLKSLSPAKSPEGSGWDRLFALREVIEEYPNSEWFWLLEQDALIMDPAFSITNDLLNPEKLDAIMERDVPIVSPDSVIRTLKSSPADDAALILSHDHAGINTNSFIVRNGDFGKYLLETWIQPLYRSYGFERKETSALEHIIQWHYTILSKTALVPKRTISSYAGAADDMAYKDGDFVVMFNGCQNEGRSCVRELERYWTARGRTVEGLDLDEMSKATIRQQKAP